MTIVAFVFAVVFGLALLFVVIAVARRASSGRASGNGSDFAWLSDGGASISSTTSSGADCGSSDGGGACDGGGGGGD
jgi:hypothetical protein